MSIFRPTGGCWIIGTMHYAVPMTEYDPTLMGSDIWFGDQVSYSVKLTWLQTLVRRMELTFKRET